MDTSEPRVPASLGLGMPRHPLTPPKELAARLSAPARSMTDSAFGVFAWHVDEGGGGGSLLPALLANTVKSRCRSCGTVAAATPSPPKVSSGIHRYAELQGPSCAPARGMQVQKAAFCPDPKHASSPVKEVMQGGGAPPWYSASADRDPVPHADL